MNTKLAVISFTFMLLGLALVATAHSFLGGLILLWGVVCLTLAVA